MRTNLRRKPVVSDSAVVTKATLRAAAKLHVTNRALARIIGVSEATVSRMGKGEHPLEPDSKPFELAVLFVRLYRALDAIAGGDDGVASAWLANESTTLEGRPLDLIQSVSGLTHVIQYLDAHRAVV
jgi:uncharacterized protein (DUF2384 family)